MKRSQDKIKDYVEPQAFDEMRDFAADPARIVAAYRFTDATSDLLARWLDALADLPPGRGAARALAGLRGVGKSHLLATFGALVAAPELRPRVPDAHVAVSAKRLAGRRAQVVRVERGIRPALVEELRAAFIAAFGRAAAEWPDDPVALIAAAVEHVHGATLVLIIDTAYGREQRVERDDGPLLSQLATAVQSTDAFVALALDDDIAGADGINAALVQTYQIDYLEPEHLYRVADLYLLRKQAQARTALHEIYLTLRHTIPNFNWSEPRFAALYPVHPLVADVAASVRLYASTFAFLPFASASALQALNRPALSLVLLDEVFDRTEEELRAARDLQDAFATYDELSTNGVAKFPAMQRLQVRLVLKLLFVLSLDGRGASARDLCAALLFHDESAPLAAVQRIDAMLQQLAAHAPGDGLSARAEQDELRYRFRIGAAREFDEALTAAVKRLPADDAVALGQLLRSFAHARFNDWPADADKAETTASLHANWRGTSRRGLLKLHVDEAAGATVAPTTEEATHYEWELIVLAPAADGVSPAPLVDKQTRPTNADDAQLPISLVWQPARMNGNDAVVLRRLLALRTDPALGAFGEPALAAHAALSTQAGHIWTRLHLDEGVLTCAGAQLALRERAQSAPTLSALLAALLDEPLAARYPQHPPFAASLNEADCARLVECMFGTVPESAAQPLIAQFALPLGLARALDDGTHTLECGETALAQAWCQTVLAIVEQAGKSGVTFAALQYALGRAPFGLNAAAQQLVVAALIAQRRLELVTPTGERLGRSAAAGGIDWANVAGVACAIVAQHDVDALTAWARQLTNNNALASLAEAGARALLREALGAWLADWRAHALVRRCEQLPDNGLTLRAWQLVKLVRRTFGVAAEAVAATLADAISLEEGLQRVADAFGNSPVQFAESAAARAALTAYVAELAAREQVRAYLAGAEPTGVEEIECARRELLLSADDAHSLFDDGACARFDLLWREFHTRYAAHYADMHEHAVGARSERTVINEALRSDAWREFEALAQLPFVNRQHRQEADVLIAELRRAHCELDVRALLATQPTCACSFRLTRAARLLNAAARLTEIVSRGRAAARRTLTLFHPHFARALNLLAHEKSSATGARAGQLANAFARGETPALLARADVRLIARAFEISPPPEPLHVPAPDLNHGSMTRAELHARMAGWLADLPHSPALVEVAAKMGSDGA